MKTIIILINFSMTLTSFAFTKTEVEGKIQAQFDTDLNNVRAYQCLSTRGRRVKAYSCLSYDFNNKPSTANWVCAFYKNAWSVGRVRRGKFQPTFACDAGVYVTRKNEAGNTEKFAGPRASELFSLAKESENWRQGPFEGLDSTDGYSPTLIQPIHCYLALSTTSMPTGQKICQSDASKPDYCTLTLAQSDDSQFKGYWWTWQSAPGKSTQICKGGVILSTDNLVTPTQLNKVEFNVNAAVTPVSCYVTEQSSKTCMEGGNCQNKNKCCSYIDYQGTQGWHIRTSSTQWKACTKGITLAAEVGSGSSGPSSNPPEESEQEAGNIDTKVVFEKTKATFIVEKVEVMNLEKDKIIMNKDVNGLKFKGSGFYTSSDQNLKEEITIIDDALKKIEQLKGVLYYWKKDIPYDYPTEERQTGLIAQDVQKVLPEAVTKREDGYLAIEYSHLAGLLVEGIKELKRQNEELRKEIEKLKRTRR